MTAETDLLPLPEWQGDFMTESEFREEAQAYARACVSSATEALRAEVAEARDGWHMANGTADLAMKHRDAAEARAERLAEALREIAASAEEATTGEGHAECASIARAALEQEAGRG